MPKIATIAIAIIIIAAGLALIFWLFGEAGDTNPQNDYFISESPLGLNEPMQSPSPDVSAPLKTSPAPTASPSPPEPLSSQIQGRYDIAQMYIQLALIRSRLANERDFSRAASGIQQISSDLESAFSGADESARQRWQQIDQNLEQAGQSAQQQSLQALDHLDRALELLRQEVSP